MRAGELTKVNALAVPPGDNGILKTIKSAKVDNPSIDRDSGLPAFPSPKDAWHSSCVRTIDLVICGVLFAAGASEINDSVVRALSVCMVYFLTRELAVHVEPRRAMSKVASPIDAQSHVTIRCAYIPSDSASVAPATYNSKTKFAIDFAIGQDLFQSRLSQHG